MGKIKKKEFKKFLALIYPEPIYFEDSTKDEIIDRGIHRTYTEIKRQEDFKGYRYSFNWLEVVICTEPKEKTLRTFSYKREAVSTYWSINYDEFAKMSRTCLANLKKEIRENLIVIDNSLSLDNYLNYLIEYLRKTPDSMEREMRLFKLSNTYLRDLNFRLSKYYVRENRRQELETQILSLEGKKCKEKRIKPNVFMDSNYYLHDDQTFFYSKMNELRNFIDSLWIDIIRFIENLHNPTKVSLISDFPKVQWRLNQKGDKSDLIELIHALFKSERILDENGNPITQTRLIELFQLYFNCDLKTFDSLLAKRKSTYKVKDDKSFINSLLHHIKEEN